MTNPNESTFIFPINLLTINKTCKSPDTTIITNIHHKKPHSLFPQSRKIPAEAIYSGIIALEIWSIIEGKLDGGTGVATEDPLILHCSAFIGYYYYSIQWSGQMRIQFSTYRTKGHCLNMQLFLNLNVALLYTVLTVA